MRKVRSSVLINITTEGFRGLTSVTVTREKEIDAVHGEQPFKMLLHGLRGFLVFVAREDFI
jgi:hypothetical protein